MADEHEETFEQATSGASATFPKQCSALRKSDCVLIKKRPCKIVEMSTSKTGKHGHAKVHMVGIDVFTQKKLEDICPSTHNMECPNVTRIDYQVLDITTDGYLCVMDDGCNERNDLKMPEDNDLCKDIRDKFESSDATLLVTVLKAMGEELVVGCKKLETK
eukprot:TRINITY_DN68111_c0_g1_i10.p1 TRINITY_DN68111_c0_g1~~TRINITY_DN68111_c0_g1_i10.p1  ORF type:complete len:161 (+),score=55.24 TRINITY_DN68111_c0_g1_i10:122-604(+)